MEMKHGNLSINSDNIFPIIKKWMYSDHDIFVRELISNACDAVTKLKKLDGAKCELKALYLLQAYHGRGLGRRLLETAISRARETGCKEMYLDTLSTSKRAIRLYEKMGFTRTKRYNGNEAADVFMVLRLDNWGG